MRVEVRAEGLALQVGNDGVGSSCTLGTPGPTVSWATFTREPAALTRCAERLEQTVASLRGKSGAVVAASPDTTYTTIVRIIDALRTTVDNKPLFDDISFVALSKS